MVRYHNGSGGWFWRAAARNAEQIRDELMALRETGLVNARRDGRRMLYRTNAEAIRPLYEWTSTFERFWRHQLSRIKDRAEAREDRPPESDPLHRGGKYDPDPSGN